MKIHRKKPSNREERLPKIAKKKCDNHVHKRKNRTFTLQYIITKKETNNYKDPSKKEESDHLRATSQDDHNKIYKRE